MRRWIALLTLAALAGAGIAVVDCPMPVGAAGLAGAAADEDHAHDRAGTPSPDRPHSERDGGTCTFAMMCPGAALIAGATVSERSAELASRDGGVEPDRAHASASPTQRTPPPRLPA